MRVRRGLLRGPAPRPLPRSGHRGRTRGRRWGPGRLAPRRGHSRPTLPPSVCGPLAARKLFSVCGPARPSVAGPFSALRGSGPQPPFGGPGPVAPPAGGRPALPRFGSGPPGPCPRTPGARGARLHPPPGALPRLFPPVVSGCSPAPAVWRRVCLRRGFLRRGFLPLPSPSGGGARLAGGRSHLGRPGLDSSGYSSLSRARALPPTAP